MLNEKRSTPRKVRLDFQHKAEVLGKSMIIRERFQKDGQRPIKMG